MATTYTATGATEQANLAVTAYDKAVEHVLRSQPLFRNFADKRPVDVTGPSAVVRLQIYADLAATTAALTEYVDPTPITLGNTSYVDVTLDEWGTSGVTTRKFELTGLAAVDMELAGQIAWNMAESLDIQAQLALADNVTAVVLYADDSDSSTVKVLADGGADEADADLGTTSGVAVADVITSNLIRSATARLRSNKAVPVKGSLYAHILSPESSADLRSETGAAAWRDPHNYSGADMIWDGEIGAYEGQFFVESPRVFRGDIGASSAEIFNGYILGRQALAEAVAEEPHIVVGPMTDSLNRFRKIGWYGLLGWKAYRSTAYIRTVAGSAYSA